MGAESLGARKVSAKDKAQENVVEAIPRVSGFLFGPFRLSLNDRALRRGGETLGIGGRGFDLLRLLLERAGAIVFKDEILETVWHDVVATEESIRVQVSALRKILEDQAKAPKYILSVPGRGYTFVGLVTRVTLERPARRSAQPKTDLILGRDQVVRDVLSMLALRRVTTIVGPGGIGKSTVAHEVAWAAGKDWTDGVFWLDLSDVTEDGLVASAVVNMLAIGVSVQDPIAGIVNFLQNKKALVVLDCCERVALGAAVLIERILESSGRVSILVTSREALRTTREHVLRLSQLEVPQTRQVSAEQAMQFSAVQLFVARASSATGHFALTDVNAPVVTELCSRLDGLPLAIELAAAHLVAFSPDQLRDLLDKGFMLSSFGYRTGQPRHQTLESALDWSYDLLKGFEPHVLRGLSVFEGAATLHAILNVISVDDLTEERVLGSLLHLTDKSLLKAESDDNGMRYRLLDTTRAYAMSRLLRVGGLEALRRRHATYLLQQASGSRIEGAAQSAAAWFGPACPNLANLRVALRWAFATNDRYLALQLTCAALPLFLQLSLLNECEEWAARALPLLTPAEAGGLVHVQLLAYRGAALLGILGPGELSRTAMDQALAAAERSGQRSYAVLALSGLFWLWMYRGEPELATACALRLREPSSAEDAPENLVSSNYIAMSTCLLGDQHLAHVRLINDQARWAQLSLGRFMRIGSDPGILSRTFLIKTLWLLGDKQAAEALYEQCVDSLREPQHALYRCLALNEIVIPFFAYHGAWDLAAGGLAELRDAATRQAMSIRVLSAECLALALELLQGRGSPQPLSEALESLRSAHLCALMPWMESVLIQSHLREGDTPGAIAAADHAIQGCDKTGAGWWLSDLIRLKGLAKAKNPASLEAGLKDLRDARDLARRQTAIALELRATLSEASCLQPLGRAREILADLQDIVARHPICDSSDLQEARNLILAFGATPFK